MNAATEPPSRTRRNGRQPRRRSALPPELERARILEAAERLLPAMEPDRLSATEICASARVSMACFQRSFADGEDCLLALFDELADRLAAEVLAAYAREKCWVDGVRAALVVVLDFLQASPPRARFLVTWGMGGRVALLARRERLVAELARGFDADRPSSDPNGADAPFGSHAMIAAALSIVRARLLESPFPPLRPLTGSLMAVMVIPFLGDGAAREELERPAA